MYLALRLFWFANALFLTLFLGILFGIAVSAGVDRLQRLRIPRGIAAALIVLTFFGLLAGFGASVAPTLREQGAELKQKLPQAVGRVQQWVNKRQSGMLGVLFGRSPAAGPAAAPAATAAGGAPPTAGGTTAGATTAHAPTERALGGRPSSGSSTWRSTPSGSRRR
jgi:hypothetical protein